jgi:soluble lytic murein transglycosylase-like protein
MNIIAIALILLGCGIGYESIKPQSKQLELPNVNSPIRYTWPEVKPPVDIHAIIHAAAKKHNISAALVKGIVAAESNFNPDAVSPKGAVGLMQLLPSTAQELGVDPTIPEQNVDAGTRYLGLLLKRYSRYRDGLRRAIAAYNAGPGVVDRFRGVPPYRETRNYLTRVLAYMGQYQKEGDRKAPFDDRKADYASLAPGLFVAAANSSSIRRPID